ncbi:MAG: VOC family protein [Chitinophagaceae bacterium]|nr:VOC family protein [Chitinophagaceae bacterium]
MKNALNWFEIPALDFQRAQNFYETVFEFQMPVIINEENFKMGLLPADAAAVGGAIVWNTNSYKPSSTEGVLIYLNANPDLEIMQHRIEKAGGKIVITKRQISPQFGFMAIFNDSEGNRLALHSNS